MICNKHLVLNCTVCFPTTSTNVVTPTVGSATASQKENAVQSHSDRNKQPMSNGTTAGPADEKVVAATTTVTPPIAGTNATTTNNLQGAVAVPPATGSLAVQPALPPNTVANPVVAGVKVKRKPGPVNPSKKLRKAIIDDDVACAILLDLRLHNDFLNSGKLLAWALQPDDEAFLSIHDYVARGQEHGFGLKVLSILRIVTNAQNLSEGEDPLEYQLDFNENPNAKGKLRMMLWHGTLKSHIKSLHENGFQLPRERGQLFGAGIYFADRISKSALYCACQTAGSTGVLLLNDVLIGTPLKYIQQPLTSTVITAPPPGFNSIMGVGQRIPDKLFEKEIDGCIWPLGRTIDNTEDIGPYLRYNEYVVYDSKQVQPKYLVKVEFTNQPCQEKLC